MIFHALRSAGKAAKLQLVENREEVALALVALASSVTNGGTQVSVDDPRVPAAIRALRPRSISADSNFVCFEFDGGFDRSGYQLIAKEHDTNSWTFSYYTKGSSLVLAVVKPRRTDSPK